jgi:hypothetical protein
MPPSNVFLDTSVLLDTILPSRRNQYKCSDSLVDCVRTGRIKGLIADYVLSEIMGILKLELERKKGTSNVARETLSPSEKVGLQGIVNNIIKIPNLKIFTPSKPISQQDIYNLVCRVCVQTKDALVLLTAMEASIKIADFGLVTRDERLLARSRSQIACAHPVAFISKCPADCLSHSFCRHRR